VPTQCWRETRPSHGWQFAFAVTVDGGCLNHSKLHIRISALFVLLLLGVIVASLATVNFVLTRSAEADIEHSLTAGERIFGLLMQDSQRQLLQSANILSSDFAFREAVATADRATVLSALGNHAARINADVAMLIDTNGNLFADTQHSDFRPSSAPRLNIARRLQRSS
jgi:nitrogen fixation/metabolism regulation signal transduction histidine kinase